MNAAPVAPPLHYELRFPPLAPGSRGFSFPCDPEGQVDMNALGERALNDYLYARAVVGLEVARPRVLPVFAAA